MRKKAIERVKLEDLIDTTIVVEPEIIDNRIEAPLRLSDRPEFPPCTDDLLLLLED